MFEKNAKSLADYLSTASSTLYGSEEREEALLTALRVKKAADEFINWLIEHY